MFRNFLTIFVGEDVAEVADVPLTDGWRSVDFIEGIVMTARLRARGSDGAIFVDVETMIRIRRQTCWGRGEILAKKAYFKLQCTCVWRMNCADIWAAQKRREHTFNPDLEIGGPVNSLRGLPLS